MIRKYRNKKITYEEIKFDSIKEKDYYRELMTLKRLGLVKELELQKKFLLQPSYKKNGKTIRAIYYIADFVYRDEKDEVHIVDVKGFKTDVYKLKKKLFEYKYDYVIEEI